MRLFFDTNVWLSAIVFPGLCAELLVAVHESGHELITCNLVRQETHEVLQRKFPRHTAAMTRFDLLWARARCVPDSGFPGHDADERLVATAFEASATHFVTGDQRELGWDPRGSMRIVAPRQAWALLVTPAP